MDVRVVKDQLILSGSVIEGDLPKIERAFKANPKITTVILRNSPGGHPQTGFRVGEIIREKELTTAVSGYCYSSCSRMYLGGVKRIFTDDFPPGATDIGFHGHYKKDGTLDTELMKQDGAAGLDHQVPRRQGRRGAGRSLGEYPDEHRAHPFLQSGPREARRGFDVFLLAAVSRRRTRPFKCEAIAKSALDLGVSTSTEIIHSHDQSGAGGRGAADPAGRSATPRSAISTNSPSSTRPRATSTGASSKSAHTGHLPCRTTASAGRGVPPG